VAFLSKFERASAELRQESARRAGDGVTPEHTAASAGLDGGDDEPGDDCEPEAAKAYRDAYQVPADYPELIRVSPEDFRRGPVRAGHAAPSPGDCA